MKYFLQLNGFKETLAILLLILPLDFLEIFNILRIRIFSPFFENSRKMSLKKLKLSKFLNCLTQREIISKKTVVNGCLQYDSKLKSVIFVVYDSEI